MTVRVDPDELREAAKKFATSRHASGAAAWPPDSGAASLLFSTAITGLKGLNTETAMTTTDDAVRSALSVIAGRRSAWETILTRSADEYADTDVTAAERLRGLGDLNEPPQGR